MDNITVNGIEYTPVCNNDARIKIVVLQRGWVLVGKYYREGNDCELRDSSTIRIWGTTDGLGQIAENGPTAKTKLDRNYGLVQFDILTQVLSINCCEEKWENVL